uniref:Uncharacterized protein n=1 Tax=viral metagenome TaxID=1070528 RepID=A0A6H2A325_9ZZZZ
MNEEYITEKLELIEDKVMRLEEKIGDCVVLLERVVDYLEEKDYEGGEKEEI